MPYANNNGVKIHYEVEGSGPPLVLQHGFSDSMRSWYGLGYVKGLKDDFRLILLDARGHGESDKPHGGEDYRPDIVASDYTKILDDLGIEKAGYWGYSMGAGIGFRSIARYALPRFSSLILGGANPYGDHIHAEELFLTYEKVLAEASEKGVEVWVTYLEKEVGAKFTPEVMASQLRNDPKALLALMKAYVDIWPSAANILPRISVPSFVYAGEADSCFADAKEATQKMPKATFFSLPGLSHGQGYFRIDIVLPLIKKFLAEIKTE